MPKAGARIEEPALLMSPPFAFPYFEFQAAMDSVQTVADRTCFWPFDIEQESKDPDLNDSAAVALLVELAPTMKPYGWGLWLGATITRNTKMCTWGTPHMFFFQILRHVVAFGSNCWAQFFVADLRCKSVISRLLYWCSSFATHQGKTKVRVRLMQRKGEKSCIHILYYNMLQYIYKLNVYILYIYINWMYTYIIYIIIYLYI